MNRAATIILAIESAVRGGSISLLRNGIEAANWIGSSDVSKAEDLLANIDILLMENNISLSEIDHIAVSAGPGSFTGIRIGIATALGLKTGLGITMSSESALKAMVFKLPPFERVIAALPVGRNAVCMQAFHQTGGEVAAVNDPHTITEDEFLKFVESAKKLNFILHSALYEKVETSETVSDVGANIAYAIGLICRENAGVVTPPLFISKSF